MLALLLFAASFELASPEALGWYDVLLAEGGYGRFDRERAAFLIRERDGSLTLEPWSDGGHHHASFRGAIPARTIAILHTHPAKYPEPSAHDHAVAKRLGIPVMAITRRGVVGAMADGSVWRVAQAIPRG